MGGIGNQLFIYATGLALASRKDCELVLDKTWYRLSDERVYGLDSFHSGAREVCSRSPLVALKLRERALLSDNVRRGTSRLARSYFFESGYGFDSEVFNLDAGATLRGYFQSWRYFDDVSNNLRSNVRKLTSPSPWFRAMLGELDERQGNYAVVHVRRGDYLRPAVMQEMGVLSVPYYRTALEKLQVADDTHLLIFSDDDSEAHSIGRQLARPHTVVNPPHESVPIESMLLMSQAPVIVCANSSFSWWAAYLGERLNQRVAVPSKWFANRTFDADDLFRPHWTRV